MKIIAFGTLKGGTGKTMVAFNVAGVLAEAHKVLLIDVDPQCNLSDSANIDTTDQDINSVRDIFDTPEIDPNDIIIKAPIDELPNLDIIPSHLRLTATEMQLVSRAGREQVMSHYIEENMDVFGEYDYVIIDTNPSMGIINQNGFLAADSIILVSDISRKAQLGAQMFTYLWGEVRRAIRKEDNVHALIVNNYDKRIKLATQLMDVYRKSKEFSDLLIQQAVPSRRILKDTELKYVPINVLDDKSEECKVFREIVRELEEKEVL